MKVGVKVIGAEPLGFDGLDARVTAMVAAVLVAG